MSHKPYTNVSYTPIYQYTAYTNQPQISRNPPQARPHPGDTIQYTTPHMTLAQPESPGRPGQRIPSQGQSKFSQRS